MGLLKRLGYIVNNKGEYVYQPTDSDAEMANRKEAADEFKNFFNNIKKIKEGTLKGFEEFIKVIFLF